MFVRILRITSRSASFGALGASSAIARYEPHNANPMQIRGRQEMLPKLDARV